MIKNGKLFPGTTMPLSTSFVDENGVGIDPLTVTFRYMSPCGTEVEWVYGTDAELVRIGVGEYQVEVVPDAPGKWCFQWQTTQPATIDEDNFVVQQSRFYRGSSGDYA